ncbi:MAG: dTDP-4-dehydrorhamnose reductase [Treponema sp.]|nr:dTDP-4-dehydrorhamnose reductase [Treponema sp.]
MIWLIGNKGMLGTELAQLLALLLKKSGAPFIGTGREVDITGPALRDFAQTRFGNTPPPGWIINCAAYTAVDKAEDDIEICRLLNVEGPGNIAALASELNAKVIHISTDYVFNGKGNKPYTEEDVADPIGVYGMTKRDGEIKLFEENEASYIIRTAWLYGKHGNNFVHTMLRLMKERESVSVVNDQRGSPTWARDLAGAICAFIRLSGEGKTIPYGVYHYTNEGEITWFDFAKEIYERAKALGILPKGCEVKPCASADFPAKVKRPAYSVLDKGKIKKALGIPIPAWDESLKRFLSEYA